MLKHLIFAVLLAAFAFHAATPASNVLTSRAAVIEAATR